MYFGSQDKNQDIHAVGNTKQSLRTGCLTVVLALFAAPAIAEENHWYAKAIGGLGWLGDTKVTGLDSQTAKLAFDGGFQAGAAAGYDLGRFRLEGEYLYQTNDANQSSDARLPVGIEGGDFSSVAVSANAIAEWDLFGSDKAITYSGLGLVWLQEVDIDFQTVLGESSFSASELAVQVFVGVEYRLSEHWVAAGEVRYLTAGEVELDGEGSAPGSIEADYDRTSLLFSVGYRF